MYETYHKQPYDIKKSMQRLKKLYTDEYVKNKKGIFEYVLGGCTDSKLLEVRIFEDRDKKTVYERQTRNTKEKRNLKLFPVCFGA